MPFANQKSVLLHDQKGNIYNFYWNEGKIIFNFFDKSKNDYSNMTLMEEATIEFDCVIDNKDKIYLILQKENGQLLLMKQEGSQWDTSELSKENQPEVYNLSIIYNKTLQIMYCASSYESKSVYRIYHHSLEENQWKTQELGDIRIKSLLNPFQIFQLKNKIILGFYDLHEGIEQIFIKEYDTEKRVWKKPIRLTSGYTDKLYIDLILYKNVVHLAYSEFYEGNLVIKYEKYKISDQNATKVLEDIVSNPTNCSHPTLVRMKDALWLCWTEHDQVSSCYSKDEGLTWSNPYLWKESKNINFFRHRFETNEENIKNYYVFNNAFGKGYPEYSFIGFGNIDSATEVSIKKKEDSYQDEINVENDRKIVKKVEVDSKSVRREEPQQKQETLRKQEAPQKELNESDEIEKLTEELRNLEERINNLEEYINRRRRGILFGPRNN